MDFNNRWEKIEEIGHGGQGKVFKVWDKQKFTNIDQIPFIIQTLSGSTAEHVKTNFTKKFGDAIIDFVGREDPNNQGALKVLHQPEDVRDYERAEERIKREIEAMADLDHPNLLKIVDKDDEAKWFVSQFYPKGTLANNLDSFKGNIFKALNAFTPLVKAVSLIHNSDMIHRDIKPQNIFLDSSDNLVLGDFGIVFFADEEHTRVSDTLENVGSRDWMPPWAYKVKIEDIKPTFDVFCLGKVLWAMISGQSILRFWDFKDEEFDLELMYSENRFIKLVNNILSKCIVRREAECVIKNADMFLTELNEVTSIIRENASLIDPKTEFKCVTCGIGSYKMIADEDVTSLRNFGINPASSSSMRIYACDYCGNVQIFDFRQSMRKPPLWRED